MRSRLFAHSSSRPRDQTVRFDKGEIFPLYDDPFGIENPATISNGFDFQPFVYFITLGVIKFPSSFCEYESNFVYSWCKRII